MIARRSDLSEGDLLVQHGIGMTIAYHNDDRGDPTMEYWAFAPHDDDDCECGRFEIRVHEIVPSERSGTLAVYYRQWFTPDGEPNGKPRRKVTALASLTALVRSRRMVRTPASVDERPKGRDGNRLGAEPASAIGAAETPKDCPEITRLVGEVA